MQLARGHLEHRVIDVVHLGRGRPPPRQLIEGRPTAEQGAASWASVSNTVCVRDEEMTLVKRSQEKSSTFSARVQEPHTRERQTHVHERPKKGTWVSRAVRARGEVRGLAG